jgi:hypothetical protein
MEVYSEKKFIFINCNVFGVWDYFRRCNQGTKSTKTDPRPTATTGQYQTPAQQLQQANIKIAEQNVIILDIKAERNAAVVEVAKLREQLAAQRNGIIESEKLLQKAIDNDEKIDYYALSMLGWKLNIPDSTGSKSKGGLP